MARKRKHRRNPGGMTMRRPLGALTAGFKPSALKDAAPIAVGALANFMLRRSVTPMLPVSFATGPASYAVGLATAGAMLLVPKYGRALFMGAVTEEVLRGLNQYVMKGGINLNGLMGLSEDDEDGYGSNMDDYETIRQAAGAPMHDFETNTNDNVDMASW